MAQTIAMNSALLIIYRLCLFQDRLNIGPVILSFLGKCQGFQDFFMGNKFFCFRRFWIIDCTDNTPFFRFDFLFRKMFLRSVQIGRHKCFHLINRLFDFSYASTFAFFASPLSTKSLAPTDSILRLKQARHWAASSPVQILLS